VRYGKSRCRSPAYDRFEGYAYQVTAAAQAWLDLDADERLFLEVAEDYAVIAVGDVIIRPS
jgi:hypothetical protein